MKNVRSFRRTALQMMVCTFVLTAATTVTRPALSDPLFGGNSIQPICPSDDHWGLDGDLPTDGQTTSAPVTPDPFDGQTVPPLVQPFNPLNPLAPESPVERPY